MIEIGGGADGAGMRIAVLQSGFNEFITKKLLDGAVEALAENGVEKEDISIIRVPGAYELAAALAAAVALDYDAFVCLGVVIRGETAHFDYICNAAALGISQIAVDKRAAVGFGVITAENTDQALARAGGNRGNKGREAALAALEMAGLFNKLRERKGRRLIT